MLGLATLLVWGLVLWQLGRVDGGRRRRKREHSPALRVLLEEEVKRNATFALWQPKSGGHGMDDGFNVRQLSVNPSISVIDDFLDHEACDRLIELALASPTLSEAEVNWKADSDLSTGNTAWRVSSSAFLAKSGPQMDPAVALLNARVAKLTRVPESALSRGNSLQIARYRAGEHYWPHYDSRHLRDLGVQAFVDLLEAGGGGAARLNFTSSKHKAMLSSAGFPYSARFATVLLFLREPESGGNTTFPLLSPTAVDEPTGPVQSQVDLLSSRNVDAHQIWRTHSTRCNHGLTVAPKKGRALLFYSHKLHEERLEDGTTTTRLGELDRLTFHGGCDVLAGEKFIANYWIELPPSLFCKDCADDGGGVLENASVSWNDESGVLLRGRRSPQQSAHVGSGGGGDSTISNAQDKEL